MPITITHGDGARNAALAIRQGRVEAQQRERDNQRQDTETRASIERTRIAEGAQRLREDSANFDREKWREQLGQINRQADQQRQDRIKTTDLFQNLLNNYVEEGVFGGLDGEEDPEGQLALQGYQALASHNIDDATDRLIAHGKGFFARKGEDARRQAESESIPVLFEQRVQSTPLRTSDIAAYTMLVASGYPIEKAVAELIKLSNGEGENDPILDALTIKADGKLTLLKNTDAFGEGVDYVKLSMEAAQAQSDLANYRLNKTHPQWIVDKLSGDAGAATGQADDPVEGEFGHINPNFPLDAEPKLTTRRSRNRKPEQSNETNSEQQQLRAMVQQAKANLGKNATKEQVQAEFNRLWGGGQ